VIIQSTLLRMYDPATTPSAGFAPFSLGQFSQLFLVPYIARLLIKEDMVCSMKEAHEEMVDSREVGHSLHIEDDEDLELESILRMNTREAIKERRAKLSTDTEVSAPTHVALRMPTGIEIESKTAGTSPIQEKLHSIPKGMKS